MSLLRSAIIFRLHTAIQELDGINAKAIATTYHFICRGDLIFPCPEDQLEEHAKVKLATLEL